MWVHMILGKHSFFKVLHKEQEIREEEDRAVGNVSWSVYGTYFRAGANVCLLLLLFLMYVITQAMYNGADWWLSVW
jgi:ATP-binding cassette subfamily C (CFTR/MRP) protein 4